MRLQKLLQAFLRVKILRRNKQSSNIIVRRSCPADSFFASIGTFVVLFEQTSRLFVEVLANVPYTGLDKQLLHNLKEVISNLWQIKLYL